MTVVLRHLLGYDDINNTAASPKPSIAKFLGHDIGKGIPESKMRDVRFLSIDVDGLDGHGRIPGHFSLGVSILDTQTLHALARGSGTAKPESRIIESHHFVVKCWEPSYQPAKDKFLFGLPETVSIHELRVKLGEMISHRDVVVLCHSSKTESKILRDLEIDLFPKYTLDTAELYKMQDGTSTTLGNLLDMVGIMHAIKDLHVAGNDANFTLRALLLLAVRDAEYQCQLDADSVLPYWISTFEAVALWLSEDELKRGIRNRREERTKEREWQMELRQQSRSQEGMGDSVWMDSRGEDEYNREPKQGGSSVKTKAKSTKTKAEPTKPSRREITLEVQKELLRRRESRRRQNNREAWVLQQSLANHQEVIGGPAVTLPTVEDGNIRFPDSSSWSMELEQQFQVELGLRVNAFLKALVKRGLIEKAAITVPTGEDRNYYLRDPSFRRIIEGQQQGLTETLRRSRTELLRQLRFVPNLQQVTGEPAVTLPTGEDGNNRTPDSSAWSMEQEQPPQKQLKQLRKKQAGLLELASFGEVTAEPGATVSHVGNENSRDPEHSAGSFEPEEQIQGHGEGGMASSAAEAADAAAAGSKAGNDHDSTPPDSTQQNVDIILHGASF